MASTDASYTDLACGGYHPFKGLLVLMIGGLLFWVALPGINVGVLIGGALVLSGLLLMATARFVRVWKHGGEQTFQVGQNYFGAFPVVETAVYRGVEVFQRKQAMFVSIFPGRAVMWIVRLTGGSGRDRLAGEVAGFRSEAQARDFAARLCR